MVDKNCIFPNYLPNIPSNTVSINKDRIIQGVHKFVNWFIFCKSLADSNCC